ncbi:hypothetical protein WJX72_007825 [[Myrmecia] bisecta]|uniref:Clusterin-associated protein 1 n=1 Tax=[Myrmecia] bisecta TaxID=41462 RepID=A0AAW1PCV8_9CHLO
MSFRELRSFVEMMRALNFPHHISLESFRAPNFELVADCLYWLYQRYDPGTDVIDDISTETDRIIFLQSIGRAMFTKARIQLNLKRLYAANGLAVKELLKTATLLYKATFEANNEEAEALDQPATAVDTRSIDPKAARQLTSEIIRSGTAIYDALQQEPEMRELRNRALTSNMDTDVIADSVREAIVSVHDNVTSISHALEEMNDHHRSLETKMEKRRSELERCEKRLSTLAGVRPAYMDEYERLQEEMQGLFTVYLERFRNLEYLEGQLSQHREAQEERMAASNRTLKKMQRRLRDEEMRILRGEAAVDESQLADGEAYDYDSQGGSSTDEGPREASPGFVTVKQPVSAMGGAIRPMSRGGVVMGSLTGGGADESDDSIDEDDDSAEDDHVSVNDGMEREVFGDRVDDGDLREGMSATDLDGDPDQEQSAEFSSDENDF